MISSGSLNTGLLMTVIWAVIFGAFSLGSIGPNIESFAKGIGASQEILQTIQRIPCIDSLDPDGYRPSNIKASLEFKDVSFIYPSRPEGTSFNKCAYCCNCFEKCQYVNTGRQVHWHCGGFGIRKVNHSTAHREILRSSRRWHIP